MHPAEGKCQRRARHFASTQLCTCFHWSSLQRTSVGSCLPRKTRSSTSQSLSLCLSISVPQSFFLACCSESRSNTQDVLNHILCVHLAWWLVVGGLFCPTRRQLRRTPKSRRAFHTRAEDCCCVELFFLDWWRRNGMASHRNASRTEAFFCVLILPTHFDDDADDLDLGVDVDVDVNEKIIICQCT